MLHDYYKNIAKIKKVQTASEGVHTIVITRRFWLRTGTRKTF